jgi:lipoprotein signal peptidase
LQITAFNIADSAITIGAILLLMDSFGWKLIADRPETTDAHENG